MGHLTGKVAIVTGSGANIGEACVRALAKAGALGVLADINLIGAERVAEEINSAGGTAFAQHTDLAEEGSIQAIIDATISRFGKIDVLHNHVADTRVEQMDGDMRLDQKDAAVWDRAFQNNTREIGRAHVGTAVTKPHPVYHHLLMKTQPQKTT